MKHNYYLIVFSKAKEVYRNLDSIKVHIYHILHAVAKEVLDSSGQPFLFPFRNLIITFNLCASTVARY